MKPIYRIVLFILICWFGYNAFRQTLESQVDDSFFILKYLFLIVLIVLTLSAIVSDIKAYRSSPKIVQFYTSLAGLFLCSIVMFRLISFYNIRQSTTLFSALQIKSDVAVIKMEFKEKGYVVINDNLSTVQHIYYGQYYRNKDTVTIFQTNYERFADNLPVNGIIQHGSSLIWKNGDTMLLVNKLLAL
jgi:hypothetical protein